jgi:hypothetical protein
LLTFTKNALLSLTLQHVEIVQERQHVLWWVLDSKQRLEIRQNKRRKLRRGEDVGDGKHIWEDVWK